MEVTRYGQTLLRTVGTEAGPTTLDELAASGEAVASAYYHLYAQDQVAPRSFQSFGQMPPGIAPRDVEILHAEWLIVSGIALAYACRVTMRPQTAGDGFLWREVESKPYKLVEFDGTKQGFMTFITEAKQRTGLDSTIIRRFDEGDDNFTAAEAEGP